EAAKLPSTTPALLSPNLLEESDSATPWTLELFDDRNHLQQDDRVLLIVENDAVFARLLMESARERGYKAVIAGRGAEGLILARKFRPYAITLDMHLPDMDGWRVLARLKEDLQTRHIPIHIITTEEDAGRGLRIGALGALNKPLKSKDELNIVFSRIAECRSPEPKTLFVVGAEGERRETIADLVSGDDVRTTRWTPGPGSVAAAVDEQPACIAVALASPAESMLQWLEELRRQPGAERLPIVVDVLDDLTADEEQRLKRLAKSLLLKDVRSPERLVDETAMFLHRPVERLASEKLEMLKRLHKAETVLAGKMALVVDDDIRNIFTMTSLLERHGMRIVTADTGLGALDRLADSPGIDVVLMDIMMPTMDGYDTIRAIRRSEEFAELPIIAITAKAMKGDREKCLEAGASDYIAKPVDVDYLLAMLQVWLHR
ncbi:MAG TPA: response regulator, partial [Pirellulales bacterium]|nr:response regulator [Pirellulales bacterium]